MSAVAHAGPPPTTAAVFEYQCLFTHDLRRKQKRWQDGRLKYHSFNKRVMVYDERGNFVGDMHWHHDYAFDEGEEVQLERGGVIVQVSSLVARKDTDLSELLDKRAKEKEQRQLQQAARSSASTAVLPRLAPCPSAAPPDHFQLRRRPLHQIIGTPTGHHGRALVPGESPFEQRQQAAAAAAAAVDSPDERAAKRRRHDGPPPSKSGYAASLFGQSLTLSATPASSVPLIRRPRPEPDSGPSDQADLPCVELEADSVPREKPKSPRHLNQKSGYAQGLFGQSLTLSHTPVSSLPPRRQPRHTNSSGLAHDADTREAQESHHPALQEQPKASRHFNQPASKPQTVWPTKETGASRNIQSTIYELEQGSFSVPRVERPKRTSPADIDVIEIDDPGPVPVQAARQPRREKGTRETAAVNQKVNDGTDVTTPRQKSSRRKLASGLPVEQDEQDSETEKREEPTRAKRTKSSTSEPATKKRTIDNAAFEPNQDVPPSLFLGTSRRPDEHVTELRIKSRKRGLLMISDAPGKPRRQATGNSARPFEGIEKSQARDGADEHHPFCSLSSAPTQATDPRHEHVTGNLAISTDGASKKDAAQDEEPATNIKRTSAQRTTSTELGNDPFRSSSPVSQEKPVSGGNASTNDSSDQRKQPSTRILHELDREPPLDDGIDVVGEDTMVHQTTTHPPSPPNRPYDPYRIPSSGEELPFPWPASSPKMEPPPANGGSKKGLAGAAREVRRAGHKPETATVTKHQRPSRRKFVLEDDEELDMHLRLPKQTLVILDDTEDSAPEMHEVARAKQPKSKKTAEGNKERSRLQDVMANLEVSENKPVKALKQKAKKQHDQAHSESQDEQAEKHRRSTRRNRVDEAEEPSLASEHDVSEEEQYPRKRQYKASTTSENRPRLEKIKKNVKSRELVGFNLAALNVSLGPRGIGMPFSVLSSSANESIQRRISNKIIMETSSDPVVEGGNGQRSPIAISTDPKPPGPDRIAVDEALSAVFSGRHTTTIPIPPTVNTQVVRPTTTDKEYPRVIENAAETCPPQAQRGLMETGGTKQLVGKKNVPVNAPGSGTTDKAKEGSIQIPDAPEVKEVTGIGPSRGHHLVIPAINDCVTRIAQATGPTTQAAPNEDSALSVTTTKNSAAQKSLIASRRQQSNAAGDVASGAKDPQVALLSTGTAQTISAPVIAGTTAIASLQPSITDLQRWPSTKQRTTEAELGAAQSKARTPGYTRSNEVAAAVQMPLNAPAQESTPAIRQQSSFITYDDDGKAEVTRAKSDAPEDIPVERTAGPAARSRVTAPFKKPIPAMRRQPSNVTVANDTHTSLTEKGPGTAGDDQKSSTHASAAPFSIDAPVQKPTPTLVQPPSDREGNIGGAFDTSGDSPETNQAPSGPAQRQRPIGLRRQIPAPRRVNNITAVPPQAEAPEVQTADSTAKAPAKIVNPASRGRKAALVSDAVGQVPQRFLPPTQPALLVPISTADLACTPFEQPPKESEKPKKKMTFPGFQSARGDGPWSREAFDLLESGRPA